MGYHNSNADLMLGILAFIIIAALVIGMWALIIMFVIKFYDALAWGAICGLAVYVVLKAAQIWRSSGVRST